MKVKKFEVSNTKDLLLMMEELVASAINMREQEEAEEEPLPPVTVTEAKALTTLPSARK